MIFTEALSALGVSDTTLSTEEKDFLDANGFLILRDVLSREQVSRIQARMDALYAEEGNEAGKDQPHPPTRRWLGDLVNKGPEFEVCFTHPRLLAAASHVLRGDFKVFSVCSNAIVPGTPGQGLHSDWPEPVPPGEYKVCNSAWLISDFTPENGATRLIPGSHRSGRLAADATPEELARETVAIAQAGDVVVFNSHTWHGAGTNRTAQERTAVLSSFTRCDLPQQVDQRRFIRPETLARLSEAARCIVDVP